MRINDASLVALANILQVRVGNASDIGLSNVLLSHALFTSTNDSFRFYSAFHKELDNLIHNLKTRPASMLNFSIILSIQRWFPSLYSVKVLSVHE